jgi:GTP-binding protein
MAQGFSAKRAEELFTAEAVFVAGAEAEDHLVSSPFPEIAFIGRSNVGKSSLINVLTGKPLARTSNTPGRTQQILFFRIGDRLMLVDMPGYGFAVADKAKIRKWNDLIDYYLRERGTLRRLCVLIDIRHGIKDNDREFMKKLGIYAIPFAVVLTKTDKITPKEVAARMAETEAEIKNIAPAWPTPFAVSSEKKQGIAELRQFLAQSVL